MKIGDKVKRIKGKHGKMKKGDVGTVSAVGNLLINLEEYGIGHDKSKFKILEANNQEKQNLITDFCVIASNGEIVAMLYEDEVIEKNGYRVVIHEEFNVIDDDGKLYYKRN